MEITSINNTYIKQLYKLKDKKNIILNQLFLVEGIHLVKEAYESNCLVEILYTENNIYNNIKNIKVTKDIINKLSTTVNPQEIIGVCKIIKKDIDWNNISKILILDNIQDPGNLGTIIRSSVGFNIDLIISSSDTVYEYNSKVIRSSQGSIFKTTIVRKDLLKEIEFLKKEGFKVYGTSLESSRYLDEIKVDSKYAICLGNEANGVRDEILNLCDENIKIKISSKLESLNVAMAGTILMYEFNKKISNK